MRASTDGLKEVECFVAANGERWSSQTLLTEALEHAAPGPNESLFLVTLLGASIGPGRTGAGPVSPPASSWLPQHSAQLLRRLLDSAAHVSCPVDATRALSASRAGPALSRGLDELFLANQRAGSAAWVSASALVLTWPRAGSERAPSFPPASPYRSVTYQDELAAGVVTATAHAAAARLSLEEVAPLLSVLCASAHSVDELLWLSDQGWPREPGGRNISQHRYNILKQLENGLRERFQSLLSQEMRGHPPPGSLHILLRSCPRGPWADLLAPSWVKAAAAAPRGGGRLAFAPTPAMLHDARMLALACARRGTLAPSGPVELLGAAAEAGDWLPALLPALFDASLSAPTQPLSAHVQSGARECACRAWLAAASRAAASSRAASTASSTGGAHSAAAYAGSTAPVVTAVDVFASLRAWADAGGGASPEADVLVWLAASASLDARRLPGLLYDADAPGVAGASDREKDLLLASARRFALAHVTTAAAAARSLGLYSDFPLHVVSPLAADVACAILDAACRALPGASEASLRPALLGCAPQVWAVVIRATGASAERVRRHRAAAAIASLASAVAASFARGGLRVSVLRALADDEARRGLAVLLGACADPPPGRETWAVAIAHAEAAARRRGGGGARSLVRGRAVRRRRVARPRRRRR